DGKWDAFPGQPIRVTGAVPVLVVMTDAAEARLQEMQALEHLIADDRVGAHRYHFALRQRPRFAEHPVLDANLSNVVQEGGAAKRAQLLSWQPHLPGDLEAQPGNPSRVPIGVGIAGVDRPGKGFDAG